MAFQTHLIPTRDWNNNYSPQNTIVSLFQTHLIPTRDWNPNYRDAPKD